MSHNLPVYNFPETIFVRVNTGGQQLDHIMSEVMEVEEAVLDEDGPFDRIIEEMVDLTHSLETYWRIMEAQRGKKYVQKMFARVEAKNRARDYYSAPAPLSAREELSR
ncbi:MAG: hypothetical protein EHM79_02075 [Geobacter sp.]|nr:MAG: hypothetical protein EHM79_02075 [Geobacter sp.]